MYVLDFMNLPGWIALISSFLVIGQLALTLIFGGIDFDIDVDGDGFGDFDLGTLISPKGLMHFLFGASWYLVLIKPVRPDHLWLWYDWVISIGLGVIVALFIALLYYGLSKLACEKEKESGEDLIGRAGTVYLNTGKGNYSCSVEISGSRTNLSVVSKSGRDDYKTGEMVEIIEYTNGIYYIN